MSNLLKLLLISLFLSITSCSPVYSEVPSATKFNTSEQKKLQAAKHWEIISNNISNRLISDISLKVTKDERILIELKDKSSFAKSLQWDLINVLTKQGYKVVKHDNLNDLSKINHAVKVDINTEVIEFRKGRKQTGRVGIPSIITTGLWVIDALAPSPAGAVTLAVYGNDAYNWFGEKQVSGDAPKTEIVIDVATSRKDEYLSVTKDIYYVSDNDKHLYDAVKEHKLKEFNIVGSK